MGRKVIEDIALCPKRKGVIQKRKAIKNSRTKLLSSRGDKVNAEINLLFARTDESWKKRESSVRKWEIEGRKGSKKEKGAGGGGVKTSASSMGRATGNRKKNIHGGEECWSGQ